jgi:hypothetical protein
MRQTSIISLASAAALVIATCGGAFAQGASTYAPGQQERPEGSKGASSSAPGQMQKQGQGDAKTFAPGQQKKETEGSGGDKSKNKNK